MGFRRLGGWAHAPIDAERAAADDAPVRVLVLWNTVRGLGPGEDECWARSEVAKLRAYEGIAAMALHPVTSAAVRHPRPYSWCLELRVAEGHTASELVRARACAEFLGDLRLLGMPPSVIAIEGELR
jgi:hypothetical protein